MANVQVLALYEMLFQNVLYKDKYNPTDAELATLWANIYGVSLAGKMDLVPLATGNNFASFDAAGQVKDSTYNAGSFALTAHNHNSLYWRLAADITYDATALTGHRLEFHVQDEAPFDIDNVSGSTLGVVTWLNADMVDGHHWSEVPPHNHDTRYIRMDVATDVTNILTFNPATGAVPFIVNVTKNTVVPNLNADLLDGREATYFATSGHNHDSIYTKKAGTESITGNWTFAVAGVGVAPFAVNLLNTGVVTNLNADKLDGLEAAAFSLTAHTHDDRYYTETEMDVSLALKLAKPTSSTTAPTSVIVAYIDPLLYTTALTLADIATTAQLALKYDEVAGVNNNFPAFATLGTTLVDSGYAATSFAPVSHNHDTVYFTETELTNGTTDISVKNLTAAALVTLTQTQAAGAQAGTISNVQTAGNPAVFFKLYIGATPYAVPGWAIP